MHVSLRRVIPACALLAVLALAGCASQAYVAAEVPARIEAYPSAYYDGHVVYWVGDRWYAYRDGVWVYYRTEPIYLYRYRAGWRGDHYWSAPHYHHRHRYHHHHHHHPRPHRHFTPPARRTVPPVQRGR